MLQSYIPLYRPIGYLAYSTLIVCLSFKFKSLSYQKTITLKLSANALLSQHRTSYSSQSLLFL